MRLQEVFRIFFKMLVATVFLGLLTGLAFFPAAVTLVGRWIPPKKNGAEESAAARAAAGEQPTKRELE